jgi:hypothetical protein
MFVEARKKQEERKGGEKIMYVLCCDFESKSHNRDNVDL